MSTTQPPFWDTVDRIRAERPSYRREAYGFVAAALGHTVESLPAERRADPERQGVGEPPLVAEARGSSREEVLTELQALASDDAELARRLARWTAMQRRPRSDAP